MQNIYIYIVKQILVARATRFLLWKDAPNLKLPFGIDIYYTELSE